MNTSGKRRRTLLALVVVVVALVFVSGVMAYRTAHQGKQTQEKPTVHYSPTTTTADHHYRTSSSGTRTKSATRTTTSQRDDDRDGVPNTADQCPYRAGQSSNRGCPVVTTTHAS